MLSNNLHVHCNSAKQYENLKSEYWLDSVQLNWFHGAHTIQMNYNCMIQ